MKKATLLGAFLCVAFMFTSCKKDYVCTCTDSNGDVTTYDLGKRTKTTAKTACAVYSLGGITCTESKK